MALVNPASAVIAKAKSKYGKRLTDKDYSALVKCASVADVVRYLKTYTHYRLYLDKVSGDIHRGNLENILRREFFNNYLSLCRYTVGGSPVTGYLIRKTEIRELMRILSLIAGGKPGEYIYSLPLYFCEHTELPLDRFAQTTSYAQLVELLAHHRFGEVLARFRFEKNEKIDLAAIDHALELYSYEELYKDLNHIKKKQDRAQLIALFDTLCDYDNYSRILRLKRFYHMNNAALREYLLPYGRLSGRMLDRVLQKEDTDEIIATLSDTSVGRAAQQSDDDGATSMRGKFEKCRRELYFSTNPEIVLLAYYIVSDTELKNIITVIEGVRYSMDTKSITQMLIR
jgi:V/A-type H+-transporting ATPase subunit C